MKGIKHKRQCVSMILFIENFRKDKPVVTENNVYPGPKKEWGIDYKGAKRICLW